MKVSVRDLSSGTVSMLNGRYLIAADGGSSPIRIRLGVGFTGRTYED